MHCASVELLLRLCQATYRPQIARRTAVKTQLHAQLQARCQALALFRCMCWRAFGPATGTYVSRGTLAQLLVGLRLLQRASETCASCITLPQIVHRSTSIIHVTHIWQVSCVVRARWHCRVERRAGKAPSSVDHHACLAPERSPLQHQRYCSCIVLRDRALAFAQEARACARVGLCAGSLVLHLDSALQHCTHGPSDHTFSYNVVEYLLR